MTPDEAPPFDWGDELPRIETARLVLRPLVAADGPALYAIFRDPEVARYWSAPPMTDPRQADDLVAECEELFRERTLFEWGVARREDDRVIGTVTLWKLEPENRRGELGFALARAGSRTRASTG
ncbi:MAG TPA: GNAT family N-acetyltransferase [Thermoanaerobaculia bacterium]|nr:GNAT family N-acetyltransferase [Thermoanaerobaculia bacterium]